MADKPSWSTSLIREGAREFRSVAFNYLFAILLPFIMSGLAIVSGIYQGLPWMYVIVAAAATFALVAWGLNAFNTLEITRSVKNKLRIERVTCDRAMTMRDGQPWVMGLKLGIRLENIGLFPVEYRIEEIESSIENRINGEKRFRNTGRVVDPLSAATYSDSAIELGDLDRNELLRAKFYVRLRYGRPGRLRHIIAKRYELVVKFVSENEISGYEGYEVPL